MYTVERFENGTGSNKRRRSAQRECVLYIDSCKPLRNHMSHHHTHMSHHHTHIGSSPPGARPARDGEIVLRDKLFLKAQKILIIQTVTSGLSTWSLPCKRACAGYLCFCSGLSSVQIRCRYRYRHGYSCTYRFRFTYRSRYSIADLKTIELRSQRFEPRAVFFSHLIDLLCVCVCVCVCV